MGWQTSKKLGENPVSYNPRFLRFIEQFAAIGEDEKIFPKMCKNCGRVFRSYPEYVRATTPLDQSLENYETIQNAPYTVQYRNCTCGSTLALAFTEENFPMLREFWAVLSEEALRTDTSLAEVLSQFREECNRYMGVDDSSLDTEPARPRRSNATT